MAMIRANLHKPLFSGLLAGTVVFIVVSLATWILYAMNHKHQFELLQDELVNLARIAALQVDPEEHKKLTKESDTNNAYYKKIIKPLVNIHNSVPDILYLYTMREIDGKIYYVLDTLNDENLLTKSVQNPSTVMEEYPFDANDKSFIHWLPNLHQGIIDIDNDFYFEDNTYILSASVPIFEKNGDFFGLLGVDFDVNLFEEKRLLIVNIAYAVLFTAFIISIIIGRQVYQVSFNLNNTHKKLRQQANTDFLTKAYNRRYFIKLADNEITRSKRHGHKISLIMMDIDFFKKINDSYGHITGDNVLILLVKMIKETKRSNDIIARLGGEEFVLLLPDTTEEGALVFAERIKNELSEMEIHTGNNNIIHITLSMGISEFHNSLDIDTWIHEADTAMYVAKETGRNRITKYHPDMENANSESK